MAKYLVADADFDKDLRTWGNRERLYRGDNVTVQARGVVSRSMTSEEVVRLLLGSGEGAAPLATRDKAMLELIYAAALRVTELLARNTL